MLSLVQNCKKKKEKKEKMNKKKKEEIREKKNIINQIPRNQKEDSYFLLFVSRNTLSCMIIFLKSKELVSVSNRRVIGGDYNK